MDLYQASGEWNRLSEGTRKARAAILRRYVERSGHRPLSGITADALEATFAAKGGHAAVNEMKALRPVFDYAHRLRFIPKDPTRGLKIEKPASRGFPTASAEEIARFQERWPVGTTERLVFDLALYTGAARSDLARLGRHSIRDGLLSYKRQKTGIECNVPLTHELRAVIARTPDIAPAFLLTSKGKPFTGPGLGNLFGQAARVSGIEARLHGLRKAFCVYWAEKGRSTHEIAAMAGHVSLSEVERYTRDADRRRMVKLLVEGP